MSWCTRNDMKVNVPKTKAMLISTRYKVNQIMASPPTLKIGNETIDISTNEKLLGIHVDNVLSWSTQIESTIKKCNTLLYLLSRIKCYLSIPVRKMFYNAYILPHQGYCWLGNVRGHFAVSPQLESLSPISLHYKTGPFAQNEGAILNIKGQFCPWPLPKLSLPHIDYCCTIWGNANSELLDSIVKFQKRAARCILDRDFDSPSYEMFADLKWMKFPERIKYQKAIMMYKISHNLAPITCKYLQELFQQTNDIHNRALRSTSDNLLYVPKPNIEQFRNSLLWVEDLEFHSRKY